MRVPLSLTTSMAGYLTNKKMSGAEKYPLVMMLEPLHACNLTCTGCGRIREYKSKLSEPVSSILEVKQDQRFPFPTDDVSGNFYWTVAPVKHGISRP